MKKVMALLAVAVMIPVVLQASPARAQYGSEGRPPDVGAFRVTLDGEMPEDKYVYVRSADVTLGTANDLVFVCTTNQERIEADPEFNQECRDGGGVNEVEFMAAPADTVEYEVILTDDYGENEKLLASDSFTMEEGVVVEVYRDLNGGTVYTETTAAASGVSRYNAPSRYGPLGEVPGTLRLRIGGELPEGVNVHLRVISGESSGTGGAWICLNGPEAAGSGGRGPCEDLGAVNEATFVWPEGKPFEYEIVLDDDGNLGNTSGYEILATGSAVMQEDLVLEESVHFDGPDAAENTDAEATSGQSNAPQSGGEEARPEGQEQSGGLLDTMAAFLRGLFG